MEVYFEKVSLKGAPYNRSAYTIKLTTYIDPHEGMCKCAGHYILPVLWQGFCKVGLWRAYYGAHFDVLLDTFFYV